MIENFNFKYRFGQNFIMDKNYIKSCVDIFNLSKDSNIVEIGAGAGVLTAELASRCKNVLAFEIDTDLQPILNQSLSQFKNAEVVFKDILKVDIKKLDEKFSKFTLVANLPYYITSPIVFKFLNQSCNCKRMLLMVQKEVGLRFCALPDTADYGVPSVILQTVADTTILKQVKRTMFIPAPKVDSCLIEIAINKPRPVKNWDEYCNFIQNCFNMKRKTLSNNLMSKLNLNKEDILNIFNKLSLPPNIRPQQLTPQNYVDLFGLIFSYEQNK